MKHEVDTNAPRDPSAPVSAGWFAVVGVLAVIVGVLRIVAEASMPTNGPFIRKP